MSRLLVYKASAGSGKTFTLAVQYIKLLIEHPAAYRQILAVTFTNKATTEMKERILSQLYGISIGDPASAAYLQSLCQETGETEERVRSRAEQALRLLIHDYSRFRVETIDSFFQLVMRNLARELELNPNLNIELDETEVLHEAVESMMERLDATSPVLQVVLSYINDRISEDKSWKVNIALEKFGRNIFNEYFVEHGNDLRRHLKENPRLITEYRTMLRELSTEARMRMTAFADRFDRLLQTNALQPDELNKKTVISNYFARLRNGEWEDKIVNNTIEACLNDPTAWAAKTSKRATEIIELATHSLMPLLNEAEQERPKQLHIANSCRLAVQHLDKLLLLSHIDEEVHRLNRENNRFLLSETNVLLHQLIGADDPSFVYEKIGAQIRHIMIDEFQDTSRLQWSNFKLLLLEGLAHGADSLIVGDVKQAIYRWRNGDWNILNPLSGRLNTVPIEERTLGTNRRSEANVVFFNNVFFRKAVTYLNALHVGELQIPCDELLRAYKDVEQESVHPHDGSIQISFVEADKEQELSYEEAMLESLGNAVKELVNVGVHRSDIAILVRKNKYITLIADYFNDVLGEVIISDEAFRLEASPSVCTVIEALRYLSDETNGVAKAALVEAYQNQVLGNGLEANELFSDQESMLPPEFLSRRQELTKLPLYELLEELYTLFSLERIPKQDAYLFAFFDGVMNYLSEYPSDITTFLDFWES
ncbi:MAG: UvrD-helicase domain-containing protein, partial [Prevotellaceae bacterium]|nr:UvrD-helicase domain-containing protein [Prevotellaceae bacterium]